MCKTPKIWALSGLSFYHLNIVCLCLELSPWSFWGSLCTHHPLSSSHSCRSSSAKSRLVSAFTPEESDLVIDPQIGRNCHRQGWETYSSYTLYIYIHIFIHVHTWYIYIYIHRYRYVCINIQYIWRDYWTIFSKYLEWPSPSLGDRKRSPPGSSSCHEGCIRRQRTVKKHGESNGLTNAFLWKIG